MRVFVFVLVAFVVVLSLPKPVGAQNILDVSSLTKYSDPLPKLLDNIITPTGTMSVILYTKLVSASFSNNCIASYPRRPSGDTTECIPDPRSK